jgi:hypothetical protein
MTRTRISMRMLICCACLSVLAACTAASSKGPDTSVTPPSVGDPPPPASIEAALTTEPFTPYAELGQSTDDGLAPNESNVALAASCMAAAGFQNDASDVPVGIFVSTNLAFAQPFGAWGYVGIAEAEQYGFFPGPAGRGIPLPGGNSGSANLSNAAQTATEKCGSIVQDFSNAQQDGSLAGIQTLANDISTDTVQDPAVKKATRAWSACMAKNGYDTPDPQTAFRKELFAINGGSGQLRVAPGSIQDLQKNKAQVAMAVTDADCTQSTDLAGIYFAVQASYEQQIVNLNQQQLNSAVERYRAAYQKEVAKLSSLLPTAPTQPPVPVGVKISRTSVSRASSSKS